MKKKLYPDDIFLMVAAVCFLVGAYEVHPVLVWFMAGVECVVFALVIAKGDNNVAPH
jgi:hypothetical protein